ncbi:hypothetical protein MNQ98_12930 [Paenibacillus sp. N3/727]|uniref:hypothetical protein n=1 Tax=Paenibacillus sp. N3/727 TaxID=2925845 RepID=UPI001F52BE6C|nr:hypothetical protein [Paenibacillus sp. N3/727]UNK20856.1 hypothetical protein MNQ98_12930 [Paenibacillus sp. N3/727]
MTTKDVLIYIFSVSLLLFAVLYGAIIFIQKRNRQEEGFSIGYESDTSSQLRYKHRQWFQAAYIYALRLPLLSSYVKRMRKKISIIHPYDEISLRYETMKITLAVAISAGLTAVLLIWMNPGLGFILVALLAAIVIHDLMIDVFMNRLERRLLVQSVELFSNVRHHYQQHGMVEESIYEGAETAGHEISIHATRIYNALISQDPEEQLDRYYETAPNRYLKAFAGIAHLVMEFGDHAKKNSSIFLQGLSGLTKEIQLEILRRDKLDYLLKGLNIIALAPVFFTKPIENWARASFPAMDEFYMSKLGMITKLSIYVVIIVAYTLLQKLQQNSESDYRAGFDRASWEEQLYRFKLLRILVNVLMPIPGTPKHEWRIRLLKESNTRLRLEWFYIRRIVSGVVAFSVVLTACMYLHHSSKRQLLYAPVSQISLFGKMNPEQEKEAYQRAETDRAVMDYLNRSNEVSFDQVKEAVITVDGKGITQDQISITAERVLSKLERFNFEYLKWWEVLSSIMAAVIAFYFPLWTLIFHRKVRSLEMKHEVYQFQTVISIIRGMERISVEGVLEWLSRFAVMFKVPIQKSLLHYEHGAELALQELKNDIWFPDFQRLVDKLLLAVDKVPIRDVFDDLEGEMAFVFEQRKQEYERMIDTKAAWGRMIGFAPMYGLIFMYLVIPLIGMSFTQMNAYYEQIQRL